MQLDETKILDLAVSRGDLTAEQARQLVAQQQALRAANQPAAIGPLLARVLPPERLEALRVAVQGAAAPTPGGGAAQQFLAQNPGFIDQPTAVHDGTHPPELGGKIPQQLGSYALEKELARGGMGAVYVARHTELDRKVALKLMLTAGPTRLKRFQIEARVTAQLRHPNIVAIHEVGEQGGLHYLVMDLIEGESLADRLKRDGPLEPEEAARIAQKLASALFYAHSHGILHRDLKPANVLIDQRGEPLLTDFGLAKQQDLAAESLTKTGQRVGTPAYMAPEQARGDKDWIDRRTDVYALGLILYQMLTGQLPYDAEAGINFMVAILYHTPAPIGQHRKGVDRDLETICLKCLEKESTRRYSGAGELADDLERWLAGEPISARRAGWLERTWKTIRRRPSFSAIALVCVALAVTALGLGWQWWGGRQQREAREHEERGLAAVAELRRAGWDAPGATAAQEALAQAVALDPTLFRSWTLLARLALERGDEEEATRCLDRARALSPLGAEGSFLRGRLHEAAGEAEAAHAAYQAAWNGGYRPPEAALRRARASARVHALRKQPLAAEDAWWDALRQRPADPDALDGVVELRLDADDATGLTRGWREVHRRLGGPGAPNLQQLLVPDHDRVQAALEAADAPLGRRVRAALAAAYYPHPETLRALDALAASDTPSLLREAARASLLGLARPLAGRKAPNDFAGWVAATGAGAGSGAAEALTLLELAPRLGEGDVPTLRTLSEAAKAPLLRAALPLAIAFAGTREGGVPLAQAHRLVARLRTDGDARVAGRAATAATALSLLFQPTPSPSEAAVLLLRRLLVEPGLRRGLFPSPRYVRALDDARSAAPTPALHLARAADLIEAGSAREAEDAVAAALKLDPQHVDALALQRQLALLAKAEGPPAPLAVGADADPGAVRRADERVAFTHRFGLLALPAPNGEVRVTAHFARALRSPRWRLAFETHGFQERSGPLLAAKKGLTLLSRFAFSHWSSIQLVGRGDQHSSVRFRLHAGDRISGKSGITYVVRQRWGESQVMSEVDFARRVWRGHAAGFAFKRSTSVVLRRPGVEAFLDGASTGPPRPRSPRRRRTAGNLALEFRWGGGEVETLVLAGRWDPETRAPPQPPTLEQRRARAEALVPLPDATPLVDQHRRRVARIPTLGDLRRLGWNAQARGLWRARRWDASIVRLPLQRGDLEIRTRVAFRPLGRDSQVGVALWTEDGDRVWFGPSHDDGRPVINLVVQRNWGLETALRQRPLGKVPTDPPLQLRLQRFGDHLVFGYAFAGERYTDMLDQPLYFPLDSDAGLALFGQCTDPPEGIPAHFAKVEVLGATTERGENR